MPRLPSLNVLVLAGFALVSIPLIAAILLTRTYVDALARQTAATVTESVRAARDTQRLLELLTTLERNALQYRVVGNPDLLAVYEERHKQLLGILARYRNGAFDGGQPGAAIESEAVAILEALRAHRHDSPRAAAAVERFERLHAAAREFKALLDRNIDASLAELESRSAAVQQALYWQAAALIPLALALAALFAALIARPIRQLGNAIRRLGEAGLDHPVSVRGARDIEELGGRLEWLRRRLRDLEQQKRTFLSHVSHELKTPLANIREGIDLLIDGTVGRLAPAQQQIAAIVRDNSLGLQKKIEDLLDFNAWQQQETRLECATFDLRALVAEVLAQHRLAAERLRLRIEQDLKAAELTADRRKLHVILDNLLSNAIKFSPGGGRILIASRPVPGGVELAVGDEGPGIPAAERERVFEPFYQGAQRQRGHVRGTGIGLSVVRAFVHAHGGRVDITEGVLCGANFRIFLPQPAAA
ncbi:MAG TPA: HAMP domain-containing sensor histidine kinase [Burkholderiales bacterium]